MRTKVYAFKPKRKGYAIYATKTYHGKSSSSTSSRSRRSGSVVSDIVSTFLANFIVCGIFGMKK